MACGFECPKISVVNSRKEMDAMGMSRRKSLVAIVRKDALRDSATNGNRLHGWAEEYPAFDHAFAETLDVRPIGAPDSKHESAIAEDGTYPTLVGLSQGCAVDPVGDND